MGSRCPHVGVVGAGAAALSWPGLLPASLAWAGRPSYSRVLGRECSRPPEGMLAGHFVTLGELCPPPAQGQPPWEGQRPASGSSQSLSSQLQPPCLSPAAGRGSGRPSQETGAVLGPPFPYLGPWAPNPCSEPAGLLLGRTERAARAADPRRASGENPHGRRSSRKPLRRPRSRELRAFFSCMAWRAIPGPLSKRKRRLDSLEAAQGAPRDPRRDSRGGVTHRVRLECDPDIPVGCRDPRCYPRGNPACRGTFGGRRKAVRDRLA